MDQAKVAAQLQNPHILKIFGIGKVEQTYYISYEHTEGKSLGAILERCRQEVFPLQIEHSLLIASKVCSALEYAHGRKNEAGRVFPRVPDPRARSWSPTRGRSGVKGFGYWPSRVKEVLAPEELRYLAPEQRNGPGEPSSGRVRPGGHPLRGVDGRRRPSPGEEAGQVATARLASPQGDDDQIPAPVADILRRSLAADPAARYPDVQDMRKALDTLLFSGDFSPTTFNLAFFMHSLYREDIEREAKRLKEDREASYLEFLTDEAARTHAARAPGARSSALGPDRAARRAGDRRAAPGVGAARDPLEPRPSVPLDPGPARARPALRPFAEPRRAGTRRQPPRRPRPGSPSTRKRRRPRGCPLAVPLLLVLLLGGGAAYYFLVMRPQASGAPAAHRRARDPERRGRWPPRPGSRSSKTS